MQKQWEDFLSGTTPTSTSVIENCILPLPETGFLSIEGQDAKKFLQGQLTCNLDEISTTQTQLGAHCNPQGRIIHLFRIFYYDKRYYLEMPASMIPIALNALKKYAVFFKVTLTDATPLWNAIGYCGHQLQHYVSKVPQQPDELTESDGLLIIKLNERYLIIGDVIPLSRLWEKLKQENTYVTSDPWTLLNFKDNIPTLYPETSEKFLPHDLDLPKLNAVSFNKGCYTGQEIIARMEYRAKIKNRLWLMSVQTERRLERGADIYDTSNIAGMLVDYTKTGYNTYSVQIMAAQTDGLFLDSDKLYPLTR